MTRTMIWVFVCAFVGYFFAGMSPGTTTKDIISSVIAGTLVGVMVARFFSALSRNKRSKHES